MKTSPDSACLGSECSGRNVLCRSESADLRRLAGMVGKVFQVPVAYAAMLGRRDRVMSRIGSGSRHWKYLRTLPLYRMLVSPLVVRDAREGVPEGATLGELRFVATAPIGTLCGQQLGVLVIADQSPRPQFSGEDLETLVDLAGLVAATVELRMLATQTLELDLRGNEAEARFRELADDAPAPIACSGFDGACEFVSRSWVTFTGQDASSQLGDGWQQAIHERYREPVLAAYGQGLQARQTFTVEAPLRRHDGVYCWARIGGTPRFLADGTFAGFLVRLTLLSEYRDPDLNSPSVFLTCCQ